MLKLTKTLGSLILLIFPSYLYCQTNLFTNIKTGGVTNIKAIMNGSNVKGYFCIYPLDKTSKNTYDYELNILDNNLKTTHTLTIPSTKSAELIDGAFNGEKFCFTFYDAKNKDHFIEHVIVNQDATIDTILPVKIKGGIGYISSQSEEKKLMGITQYIYPVGKTGFAWLQNFGTKDANIEVFGIDGKAMWSSQPFSEEKRSTVEIKILNSDSAMILSLITSYKTTGPNTVKKDLSTFIAYNSANGKVIAKRDLINEKYGLELQNAFYNKTNDEFILVGEYFDLTSSGKSNTNKKLGIFSYKIDTEGELKEYYNSWESDFSKKVTVNSKNKMENNRRVYFHSAVHVGSSYYYLGEQFKGGYDPNDGASVVTSFAMGVMSGGGPIQSDYPVDLYDIVAVKLNEGFKIDSVQVIEKADEHFGVPRNILTDESSVKYMSDHLLFNYKFTTVSDNGFSSVFLNFDKKKKDGVYYSIYVLSLDSNSDIVVNKVKIDKKPDFFTVLPAKPGYIAIYEYTKKNKSADFRLEKLDL